MSATDRIRARIERAYKPAMSAVKSSDVLVPVPDAEALCDIAYHAAALIGSGVHDDDGDAIAIRDALARLDGEDGDG